eukprot:COSAG02_NODE_3328_length_6928_cov_3.402109_2_plen_258_part_00
MIVRVGLGLLMGTRMWYRMWDAGTYDDVAFEHRMDALCREIGTRAQLAEAVPPEPTATPKNHAPEPTPAPAPASASPVTPAPAPTPSPAPATAPEMAPAELRADVAHAPQAQQKRQLGSSAGIGEAQGSFSEMVKFMRQEREHMEVKLEAQRQEMEKLQRMVFESQQPQEAISAAQVDALMARLEALHAAKLLSDDELFVIEDLVMDFSEVRGTLGVVTMEAVHTNHVVGKVHKLLSVSEAAPRDATLARQLRRKFV